MEIVCIRKEGEILPGDLNSVHEGWYLSKRLSMLRVSFYLKLTVHHDNA
jgi:hypothetical protein